MKYLNTLILLSLFLLSCNKQSTDQRAEEVVNPEVLTLTPNQMRAANIALGKLERRSIEKFIRVNGTLNVPPQNQITISAPMNGFVRSTNILSGMKVNKGDILVVLQHQDYIQVQQDYLEKNSRLEFLETDYRRQQKLANENINSQKTLQQAKTEYESMKATVSALKEKLNMISISPETLTDTTIRSTITLRSPITGFITVANVNIGQFVSTTNVMFKIVNLEHIHAELQVYEHDISKVSIGQKVLLQVSNEAKTRAASVYLIGKEINVDRTIQVHCHLEEDDQKLLPGSFVMSTIQTGATEVFTLPSSAIVSFEGKNYIFVSSKANEFTPVEVNVGGGANDFVEVIMNDTFNEESPIVITGTFELLGLLKNNQE